MKRLATIVFVAALAVVAACGKDKKKDGPAAGSATGPAVGSATTPTTTPTTPTTGSAATGSAAGSAATGTPSGDPAATAAGSGKAAAALTEAQVDELGGRILTIIESVAGAVEANTSDCGAMATAVEKVLADNDAALAEIRAKTDGENAANEAKFEAWMAKNQSRATAAAMRLGPGMQKCSGEARLQAAFAKLDM